MVRQVDLVLRDSEGDAWVYIGGDAYALATDVQRGEKYAERYSMTREQIESSAGAVVTERWEMWV